MRLIAWAPDIACFVKYCSYCVTQNNKMHTRCDKSTDAMCLWHHVDLRCTDIAVRRLSPLPPLNSGAFHSTIPPLPPPPSPAHMNILIFLIIILVVAKHITFDKRYSYLLAFVPYVQISLNITLSFFFFIFFVICIRSNVCVWVYV